MWGSEGSSLIFWLESIPYKTFCLKYLEVLRRYQVLQFVSMQKPKRWRLKFARHEALGSPLLAVHSSNKFNKYCRAVFLISGIHAELLLHLVPVSRGMLQLQRAVQTSAWLMTPFKYSFDSILKCFSRKVVTTTLFHAWRGETSQRNNA